MRRTLLFACCLASAAARAEDGCRIVLGADAMRLVGDSSERALKVCPVPSTRAPTIYRLSDVWRSPEGVCHYVEETEPYNPRREYTPLPTNRADAARPGRRLLLYASFGQRCERQDSPAYFPVLSPVPEEAIYRIRKTWNELHASPGAFASMVRRFDEATGGAARGWQPGHLRIRFIDTVDGPRWRMALGPAYVLGLEDREGRQYVATVATDDASLIGSILPAVP